MSDSDTVKLLRECNSGIQMAVFSIDEILEKVTDKNLYEILKKSKEKQSIWVEASKEYIFKHMHEKIRVQEIADYLHLNSSYLSELFKQQESMTLTDFILQEKVKLTKNLLTYSPYSYIEIATYLGFSSQSHLGKVFKKYTDMTLRQYRERYGREQIQERRKAELISNE